MRDVVNLNDYALADTAFRASCRDALDERGCLVLKRFLTHDATQSVCEEALRNQHLAFYCRQKHNVYLTPDEANYASEHPQNRELTSTKGCITDNQIPTESVLRILYNSLAFREFLCTVLGEDELHEYADPLSSINIHYAGEGQELAWHFDNSSFAITLLIQPPESGGDFQYIRGNRYAADGSLNYESVRQVLDDELDPLELEMAAGTLVLFRGQDSIHRVTPVIGKQTRILAVLAYNSQPGIELSESARLTFYGRLGGLALTAAATHQFW